MIGRAVAHRRSPCKGCKNRDYDRECYLHCELKTAYLNGEKRDMRFELELGGPMGTAVHFKSEPEAAAVHGPEKLQLITEPVIVSLPSPDPGTAPAPPPASPASLNEMPAPAASPKMCKKHPERPSHLDRNGRATGYCLECHQERGRRNVKGSNFSKMGQASAAARQDKALALGALVEKLPAFEACLNEDIQAKWLDIYQELLKLVK